MGKSFEEKLQELIEAESTAHRNYIRSLEERITARASALLSHVSIMVGISTAFLLYSGADKFQKIAISYSVISILLYLTSAVLCSCALVSAPLHISLVEAASLYIDMLSRKRRVVTDKQLYSKARASQYYLFFAFSISVAATVYFMFIFFFIYLPHILGFSNDVRDFIGSVASSINFDWALYLWNKLFKH